MKKLLLALSIFAASFAHADPLSDGILLGALGTIFLDHLRGPQTVIIQTPPAQVYQVQPPVYVRPQNLVCGMNVVCQNPNRTCLQHPVYDQYGRLVGYQISCH